MSYDLRVWVADPVAARTHATSAVNCAAPGWQIVVNAPESVDEEDIPESIREALPGIAMVIELNLAPATAPADARSKLQRLARRLARLAHGVVEDPQRDEIETPPGIKRLHDRPWEGRGSALQPERS